MDINMDAVPPFFQTGCILGQPVYELKSRKMWMKFSRVGQPNAVVTTVQGSIPVSSDTVESEGQQMKQC